MFVGIKREKNKKHFVLVKNTAAKVNNNTKYKIFDKIEINDII